MTDRELMQQALDLLPNAIDCQQTEINDHITNYGEWYRPQRVEYMKRFLKDAEQLMEALRARLAQPEPVDKHFRFSGPMHVVCQCDKCKAQPEPDELALIEQAMIEAWKPVSQLVEPEPEPKKYLQPNEDGFVTVEAMWGKDFFEIQVPDCIGEIVRIYHKQWRGEEQPEPEPVAWVYPRFWDDLERVNCGTAYRNPTVDREPLYTAPPRKEWQGLTDEEIGMLTVFDGLHHVEVPLLANFVRAIEAKLKEKNGGG